MATETPGQTETFAASPWLRAARSLEGKLGIGLGLLSVLVSVVEKTVGFLDRIGISKSSWNVIAWLLVIAAIGFYLREVVRARRFVIHRPTTAFIGADSFTERDQKRFFGRNNEIEEITRKLVDNPQLRFFILSGESGCGKTSLIRAGLMPELEQKHDCATLYLRLYNHPAKSLREGLQKIRAPGELVAAPAPKLFAELQAAHARSGKGTLVLFIDQFQEFFINPLPTNERKLFFDFVRDTVGAADAPFKLVFALRSEFFERMSDFDDYIEDVFQQANRKRIDLFVRERARTVIQLSLQSAADDPAQGLPWSGSLIERVLNDLEIERRGSVLTETGPIVLPAELQIVCQMVQRRGWVEARQYTSKEQLIRDYLAEAIEASPSPNLSKLMLLALIHENNISRAQPQTPAEIARKVSALTAIEARRYLEYLDVNCRLVSQVVQQKSPDSSKEIAYELAHDYLVNIINSLTGTVMDESRRANLSLQEHRTRHVYDHGHRVPIADCWRIRKHATIQITAEDRLLLRRSIRTFAYRAGAVMILPVLLVCAVRYSTVHFDTRYDEKRNSTVVVRQGLSFLQPLLGSNTILVDTGVELNDLAEDGAAACRNHEWLMSFQHEAGARWAGYLKQWRKEKLLKELDAPDPIAVARAADELLKLNLLDEKSIASALLRRLNGRTFEQSGEADLSGIVNLLLRLNVERDVIAQPLRRMWSNHRPGGQPGALLLKISVQDDEVVSTFSKHFRERAGQYISYGDFKDLEPSLPLFRYDSGESSFGESSELNGLNNELNTDNKAKERSLNNELNEQGHNYQASYNLSTVARDGREVQDSWLIELMREKLTKGTAKEVVAATNTLAKLKVKSLWVRELLQQRLHEEPVAKKTQQSLASNIEQQILDEESVAMAAAHSLFFIGMSDKTVLDTLHTHLSQAHDTIPFWLIVDCCVRHKVKEQWLIDALLNKLRGPNQEESALAAAALVQLRVKNKELVDWLLSKLDTPEMASKAAEDLGELSGVDNSRVAGILRQRLVLEMGEGDEGDMALLSAAANSMVKLGAQDQVVLGALLRSIERVRSLDKGGMEIRKSAKTLHDLNRLDQQAIALMRKRLDDKDPLIGRAVAKILEDFDVRDEITLEKLREQLDSSGSNFSEETEEAYAKLALLDPAQRFEEKLERLWRELLSPAADSSIGYRHAVQKAFELLAEQQLGNKVGGAQAVEAIRSKLNTLRNAAEIHRQIAAYEILENIDKTINERQQESSRLRPYQNLWLPTSESLNIWATPVIM